MNWKGSMGMYIQIVVVFLAIFILASIFGPRSIGLSSIPGSAIKQCNVQVPIKNDCELVKNYTCNYVMGTGSPFAWYEVTLLWSAEASVCNGVLLEPMGGYPTAHWDHVLFDPVNFILDVLVWLAVTFLLVMTYDKLKKKPEEKKRK